MKVTVVGSGSWGTALAICLCANRHDVTLWSHDAQKAEKLAAERENPSLKGVRLPDSLKISSDPACVAEDDMTVIAAPSFAIRNVCRAVAPYLPKTTVLVSVTKGIEPETLMRMTEIAEQETGISAIALTGPSHAEEVALGVPTACLAASGDREKAEAVQKAFLSDTFRIYISPDVPGAELGGASKNVIALCAGVIDGMGYGDNTKAMLLTRGIAEMTRLGTAMGARKETFAGIAGIGDLIVTCTSEHSRNRRAGIYIGQGLSVEEAMEEVGGVVEGYYAAKSIMQLAERKGVDMPIMSAAYAVLYKNFDTRRVVPILMNRAPKTETEDSVW